MGKGKNRLSAKFVETVKGNGKLVRYADGHGLYLIVRANGSKSWSYIWVRHSRRREIGLGSAGGTQTVSLAQARLNADKVREQIAAGLDPIRERNREKPKTFGDCADMLIAKLEPEWTKPKHGAHWRRMKVKTKSLLKVPIAEISISDLIPILQPVFTKTPATGKRLRSMIERVIDLATAHGWREGDNPARWKGNLEHRITVPKPVKGEKAHFAAMPYDEVPAFMSELVSRDAMAAMALRFTILTAARTSETLEAVWDEIDLEAREWTVPAVRMKKGKAHTVPLSDGAMAILEPLYEHRYSDYVFPGQSPRKPLSNMSMLMLMRRMKIEGATVHGYRSAFKDYSSDKTSFADEVSEFALAHSIPDSTKAAYRRLTALDKRALLMQQWSDYCHGVEFSKVVKIRG